jgi:hypothetical protein
VVSSTTGTASTVLAWLEASGSRVTTRGIDLVLFLFRPYLVPKKKG